MVCSFSLVCREAVMAREKGHWQTEFALARSGLLDRAVGPPVAAFHRPGEH